MDAMKNPKDMDGPDDESGLDQSEDILAEARERRKYHDDCDRDNRKAALEDTEFVWVKGKQWPDKVRLDREAEDRPWLEINQLPQFIKQVVNDQRQGRPAIIVNPASGDASKEVAQILQGMTRHIEYESNAEAAYDSAFEQAVTGGRGYWRICTDYEDDASFDQVIQIKRVPDAMAVRLDPDYQEPDASDIGWALVEEVVTKSDFQQRWPDAEVLSWNSPDSEQTWYDGNDKVIVADYYRKVYTPRTLVYMSDGAIGYEDEMPTPPEGVTVLRKRLVNDCVVEWYKIAGGEQVLEQYEWPGKYIPVVMCVGDEIMVNGKRVFQGLIRRARDVQMMYNFWQTQATELIAMAPRSPYVMAEGQDEGYEQMWATANTRSYSVLKYKQTDIEGRQAPAPQRTPFAGVPTGIVEQANQCKMDLRATIGIYDPSLGNKSNETSGRAIVAREKQGDTATFHFVDNLSRAISLTGRIVLDLIPHYYDTERIVGTVGEDNTAKPVAINQAQPHPMDPAQQIVKNNIKVGKYAVTVEAGPGYQTRMAEAADSMMQFLQAIPAAAPLIGDLIARNMPWPGSDQIADRLKAVLPPPVKAVADAADGVKSQQLPIPPQVQQQMAQMQQALQGLQQENQQLKAGMQEAIAVAQINAQTDVKVAEINAIAKIQAQEIAANMKLSMPDAGAMQAIGNAVPTPTPESAQQQGNPMAELAQAITALAQSTMAPRHMATVKGPDGSVSVVSMPASGVQ